MWEFEPKLTFGLDAAPAAAAATVADMMPHLEGLKHGSEGESPYVGFVASCVPPDDLTKAVLLGMLGMSGEYLPRYLSEDVSGRQCCFETDEAWFCAIEENEGELHDEQRKQNQAAMLLSGAVDGVVHLLRSDTPGAWPCFWCGYFDNNTVIGVVAMDVST
eukprot:PLAT5040.1.p1 GENE.PLAT5040.1~~PLAT5040.1.p1  ORF type:complete len:161 (-),score=14.90 PLAT5040.1:109-591(-)